MLDGQENGNWQTSRPDQVEASIDAIQEITTQTSNFNAEYGQVLGGLFNLSSKSGTNQFHGSAYDFLQNDKLNAGIPFTNNGNGGVVTAYNPKERLRRQLRRAGRDSSHLQRPRQDVLLLQHRSVP